MFMRIQDPCGNKFLRLGGTFLMSLKFVRFCIFSCLISLAAGCTTQAPPISVAVSPQFTAVATGETVQLAATVTNDTTGVTWSTTVGTVDASGNYTAPSGAQSTTATVTATSRKDPAKFASATVHVVAPGQVSATANDNPQVALYTISPASAANVSVQFGIDTNYRQTTWAQPVPQGGGPVNILVAGMKANTQYRLRGVVQFADGAQFTDADQMFLTGSYPSAQLPKLTATTTPGMTPQSGVELLDLIGSAESPAAMTDLDGNLLWGYNPGLSLQANPIKLLANGHFLINFSRCHPDGIDSVLQEVDLSGALIWQLTAADLNAALASAKAAGTCTGCDITVIGTHHDFVLLPNGHLIVIASLQNSIFSPGQRLLGTRSLI